MGAIQIDPKETSRSQAWDLWMQSPMPMVTITKTFNVSRIIKVSKKERIGFNALLCYIIAKAASPISEFYMLPVGEKFMKYDKLAVNVIVNNTKGGINSCDIPFDNNLFQFVQDYNRLTALVSEKAESIFDENRMIIGTSALPLCEIDSIQNQYTKLFSNPFLAWGKYRKRWCKTDLPISFQFHHVQMDGGHAVSFLAQIQKEINQI